MNVLERIKTLCKERGVSQRTLESACGLSNGSVSKWGKHAPQSDALAKVAEYFNVPLDFLMSGVQTDEQPTPYYLNDTTREIANAVYADKNLRILFDNSRKMSPEDLKALIAVQQAILRRENDD